MACTVGLSVEDKEYSPVEQLTIMEVLPRLTNWRSIALVTVIAFLTAVETSIVNNGEWPYMISIDSGTTSNFNGIATSVTQAAHALSVLLFAAASHQFRSVKILLMAGRLISLTGCLLYLSVEFFPYNRRFILLACYIIFATGSGPIPLLRAIVSHTSAEDNRTKAFAVFNLAVVLANIISPLVQLAFSAIHYPGDKIFGSLKFNIYTAPIFVAILLNIACLLIVVIIFKDPSKRKDTERLQWSMASLRRRLILLKKAPFSWPLIIVLILHRAFFELTGSTIASTAGPIFTTTFALSGPQVVQLMSIAQLVIGVVAIGVSLLFMLVKMGRWISNRLLYLIAYLTVVAMYIASYPWPMWSSHLQPFNETTITGCNPEEYSWCDHVLTSSLWTWVPVLVLVMGFAIPATNISFDSIYSKALGDIDQGPMQSVLTVAQDVLSIAAPMYASSVYTAAGLPLLWIINFSIVVVAVVVWLVIWRPLGKYQ